MREQALAVIPHGRINLITFQDFQLCDGRGRGDALHHRGVSVAQEAAVEGRGSSPADSAGNGLARVNGGNGQFTGTLLWFVR